MKRTPLVASIGEALIDFVAVEIGRDVGKAETFKKAPGGAVANTAIGLARLGVGSRLITRSGDDPFGRFIKDNLEAEGVDTSFVSVSEEYPTALVFVGLDQDRTPGFYFFGYPSADMMITEDEVGPECLSGADFFHCGTVSMVRPECGGATFKLIRLARENQVKVSFDPNLRLHLWKDHDLLRETAMRAIVDSDLVKLNEGELEFITGEKDLEKGAEKILAAGPDVIVVTGGPGGAWYRCGGFAGEVPGFEVEVVDTTGSGDGFMAGLLAVLLEKDGWPPGKQDLETAVRFANAVGAKVATQLGAVAALPTRAEVESMLG